MPQGWGFGGGGQNQFGGRDLSGEQVPGAYWDESQQRWVNPPNVPTGPGLAGTLPDSWGSLMKSLEGVEGQTGPAGALADLLRNFRGGSRDLEKFMRRAAPFIAAQIGATPAFQQTQDFTSAADAVMGAYGPAAGQIGQGFSQGQRVGQQNLARAGLGRSAAMGSIAQQAQGGAATAQSNLYQNLFQEKTRMKQQFANEAVDQQRALATLAMGGIPAPRQKQQSSGSGVAALGGGIGSILASLIPGGGVITGGGGGGLFGESNAL